jgi:hypothetical protein
MGGGGGALRGISRKFSGHVSDPDARLPLAERPRGAILPLPARFGALRAQVSLAVQSCMGPRVIEGEVCTVCFCAVLLWRGGQFGQGVKGVEASVFCMCTRHWTKRPLYSGMGHYVFVFLGSNLVDEIIFGIPPKVSLDIPIEKGKISK